MGPAVGRAEHLGRGHSTLLYSAFGVLDGHLLMYLGLYAAPRFPVKRDLSRIPRWTQTGTIEPFERIARGWNCGMMVLCPLILA